MTTVIGVSVYLWGAFEIGSGFYELFYVSTLVGPTRYRGRGEDLTTDFFETHLWQWFSKREIAVIAICLAATVGVLVLRYARAKGWDREWKDRWEQRHEKSLGVLLRTKRRNLKNVLLTRWVTFALFFMGLGASFGPVYGMASGLHRLPKLVIEAMISMNLILLLGLLVGIAAVGVARFEIRRLEQLLCAPANDRSGDVDAG